MSTDDKNSEKSTPEPKKAETEKTESKKPASTTRPDPANPEAERKPGQMARTDNEVEAKDAFGAPRRDTGWTREALDSATRAPGLDGPNDKVKKERAKDFKQ